MRLRNFNAIVCAFAATSIGLTLHSRQTPPAPEKVLLAEGVAVSLRMAQVINSRTARPGDPVELALAADLKEGNVIVAKAGARALGEVVQGKRPDFWGRGRRGQCPSAFPAGG